MFILWLINCSGFPFTVYKTGKNSKTNDPFDTLPKHFWHEISSPFTDIPDEDIEDETDETTTHDPYPYFEDPTMMTNVTTQVILCS